MSARTAADGSILVVDLFHSDIVKCHVYVTNEVELAAAEATSEVDLFEKAWAAHEQKLTQTVLKVRFFQSMSEVVHALLVTWLSSSQLLCHYFPVSPFLCIFSPSSSLSLSLSLSFAPSLLALTLASRLPLCLLLSSVLCRASWVTTGSCRTRTVARRRTSTFAPAPCTASTR